MANKELENKTRLMDTPILNCNEDCFGVKDYAEALYQFINTANTPTVLSLEGGWGEGKTSLLNLIDEKLMNKGSSKEKFFHIRFDSWKFVFSNDMNKAFLNLVLGEILKVKGFKEWIKSQKNEDIFGPVVSFIGEIGVSVFKKYTDIDISDKIEHTKNIRGQNIRESFKNIIKNLIESKGNDFKIVISLDDLDRIQPLKAIEIIEIIKNFLDVEGVIFLLVVDKDIIKKGLSEKFDLSDYDLDKKEDFFDLYFDKIIQLSFHLPKKDKKEEIKKYISSILNIEEGIELNDNFIDIINDLKYLGSNPRSIKRLTNIYTLKKIYYNIGNNNEKKFDKDIFNALFLSSLKTTNKSFNEDFGHLKELEKKFSFINEKVFTQIEEKTNIISSNFKYSSSVDISEDDLRDNILKLFNGREEYVDTFYELFSILIDLEDITFQYRSGDILCKYNNGSKQIQIMHFSFLKSGKLKMTLKYNNDKQILKTNFTNVINEKYLTLEGIVSHLNYNKTKDQYDNQEYVQYIMIELLDINNINNALKKDLENIISETIENNK